MNMESEIKNNDEIENNDLNDEFPTQDKPFEDTEQKPAIVEEDFQNDEISAEIPSELDEEVIPEPLEEEILPKDSEDTELEFPKEEVQEEELTVAQIIEAPAIEVQVIETPVIEVVPEKKFIIQAPSAILTEVDRRKVYKRILQGKVHSNKPDKTIIVSIERQVKHPLYKKYYKRTKRVMAHDEQNECNIGDIVRVRESRPLSARKRWELIQIVERAK